MAITRHSPCCDPGSIPGIGVIFCLPFLLTLLGFFFFELFQNSITCQQFPQNVIRYG